MAAPRTKAKASGFTIIELMIVITIATVLATVVLPGLIAQNQDKLVERIAEDYHALEQAVLVYYMQGEDGGWPTDCNGFLEQQVLVDQGYLGQVLRPPQSDYQYLVEIDDNGAGTGCDLVLMSPENFASSFDDLFEMLETTISGLECEPQSFPCQKRLPESLIVNFAAGGGGGSSFGGSIFEQLEEACCTTISTKGKVNNCPAGIMTSVWNKGAWAECCTPPPCPPP